MSDKDLPVDPEEEEPQVDPPAAVQWMIQQAAAGQSNVSLPVTPGELPAAALGPGLSEAALAARERRVADALRGNERLTEGLPHEAAGALLDLGLDLARDVVRDTARLDDAAAEDVLQPRVRAVRRLMMSAAQSRDGEPDDVLKQAAVALGDRFRSPDADAQQQFLRRWRERTGDPAAQVTTLREFIDQLKNPLL